MHAPHCFELREQTVCMQLLGADALQDSALTTMLAMRGLHHLSAVVVSKPLRALECTIGPKVVGWHWMQLALADDASAVEVMWQ